MAAMIPKLWQLQQRASFEDTTLNGHEGVTYKATQLQRPVFILESFAKLVYFPQRKKTKALIRLRGCAGLSEPL